MDVYLAGENGKQRIIEEFMPFEHRGKTIDVHSLSILDTFFYRRNNPPTYIHKVKNFLLDSGAFTFMMNKGSAKVDTDIDSYVDKYIGFINDNDVSQFIELDIDLVVGLEKVEQIRRRLESRTQRQCIPVWHIWRGKQYFLDMVKEYPRVCFGGLMSDGLSVNTIEKYLPWFIDKAHENGCKIHGLGYTRLDKLSQFYFDSVDSTSWLMGNRGGYVYVYNNDLTMSKYQKEGCRLKSREGGRHNFIEWVKFQQDAYDRL